ncbi:MAG: ABC transporter permease [Lachnospiraceae bacterium]|nr:ABC transporter permease [Lachnospiraceae bacterium]
MIHLMKYRLLQMTRNKVLMFWSLVFPIILATFFNIAFGSVNSDQMGRIPVAVVEKTSQSGDTQLSYFTEMLNQLDGDTLEVNYMTEKQAKKALREEEVDGIYYVGNELSLMVAKNDIGPSILESLLASYEQQSAMVEDIALHHPEQLKQVLSGLAEESDTEEGGGYTKEVSLGATTLDTDMNFFFALIAMACLYGGFLGLDNPLTTQANLSAVGARKSLGAKPKLLIIISDMLVVEAVHFINVCVLLFYLHFVLGKDLSPHIGRVLLICLFGSLIGVCLGIMIGSLGKMGEGGKIGTFLTISMVCSAFAGLFADSIKTSIESVLPWIAKVNPAALIADSFYYLTVYDDKNRYMLNILILAGISVVFLIISFLSVRRERYESI